MKYLRTNLFIILIAFFIISTNSFCQEHPKNEHKVHWGYSGEYGPDNWGNIKPEYKLCDSGLYQSPIDFNNPISSSIEKIIFNYKPASLNIINNGHTIEINYTNGSNAVIDGKKYTLLQFHFHTPSEHTVNGKHFDMEMHLIHKNKNGQLAVIGVFIKIGNENINLNNIIVHIPDHQNDASRL